MKLGAEKFDCYHLAVHSVQVLASSAAEDLHTQVEGVSELHRDDTQVASSDQPTEPARHGRPAHHPNLKHLRDNQEDTFTWALIITSRGIRGLSI